MRSFMILFTLLLVPTFSVACDRTLLASGYFSNNVHVYNGCDGTFLHRLDNSGRISGAQALAYDGGELVYVASEENNRVLRYRASDLSFVDVFAGADGLAPLRVQKPTGIAIGPDGDVYVAGYASNDVVRLRADTAAEVAHYALASAGLAGADAGLAFLPDGRLLVPGFDSSNIIALDPDSGQASVWAPAGTEGLTNPRVIRYEPATDTVVVSAWGTSRLLRFNLQGQLQGVVLRSGSPTGFVRRADGDILVTNDRSSGVFVYDAQGNFSSTLVGSGSGGLEGGTFLLELGPDDEGEPGAEATSDQAWMIGVGGLVDGVAVVPMTITTGTRFGADFSPTDVQRTPWGELRFELLDCETATMSWEPDAPGYQAGAYGLVRVAPNAAQQRCMAEGLSADAATGSWFGGPDRDGEGLLVDHLGEGQLVITWFTYRPKSAAEGQ